MKIRILLAAVGVLALQSCQEATLQVQNNVSNARIQQVFWGDRSVAAELLPGQTSDELKITGSENLPASHKVSFVMYANERSVYLETEEEYYINDGEDILIEIDDETPVSNPN